MVVGQFLHLIAKPFYHVFRDAAALELFQGVVGVTTIFALLPYGLQLCLFASLTISLRVSPVISARLIRIMTPSVFGLKPLPDF